MNIGTLVLNDFVSNKNVHLVVQIDKVYEDKSILCSATLRDDKDIILYDYGTISLNEGSKLSIDDIIAKLRITIA